MTTDTTNIIQLGDMAEVESAAAELIVRIMQKNAADAAWTTNQLLDSYERRTKELEAALALIRDGIGRLLDGPWMPTSRAIEAALWPSSERVQERMKLTGGTV